jgi:hypothetical protein
MLNSLQIRVKMVNMVILYKYRFYTMFFSKSSRTDRYSTQVEYLATLADFSIEAVILSQPQKQFCVDMFVEHIKLQNC